MIHWIELAVLLPLALIVAYAMGRLHGMRAADRIHKKYAIPEPTDMAPAMTDEDFYLQNDKPPSLSLWAGELDPEEKIKQYKLDTEKWYRGAEANMSRRRDDNRSHQEPSEPWS